MKSNTEVFLDDARQESERARELFPYQETTVPLEGWLCILTEEVGEVARELNERLLNPPNNQSAFEKRIRAELVQVAAMAERMAEACRLQVELWNEEQS